MRLCRGGAGHLRAWPLDAGGVVNFPSANFAGWQQPRVYTWWRVTSTTMARPIWPRTAGRAATYSSGFFEKRPSRTHPCHQRHCSIFPAFVVDNAAVVITGEFVK